MLPVFFLIFPLPSIKKATLKAQSEVYDFPSFIHTTTHFILQWNEEAKEGVSHVAAKQMVIIFDQRLLAAEFFKIFFLHLEFQLNWETWNWKNSKDKNESAQLKIKFHSTFFLIFSLNLREGQI